MRSGSFLAWTSALVLALTVLGLSIASDMDSLDGLYLAVWGTQAFLGWCCFTFVSWMLAHSVLRRKPALTWKYWGYANRVFLLLVITGSCWWLWLTADEKNIEYAKAFVKAAEPAIEKYYRENAHYPRSLSQLGLSMPIPVGLEYHVSTLDQDEWNVCSYHDGECYSIFLGDLWYEGNGHWDVGHL
jgi:hypothetical protein